ncbi:DUF1501 domain-containing protein [Rubinisphaera sp.]|uniref:DUF1501 domain-containing protein n=1 Tax=Rubinisphaera sp. TaxID=2024857 RepID=UPI000C0F794A|nr:DUF1501 domain-containing protein [Rubinisphaera sp.]MBV10605.1 hypothetical protein [Rubinisphaera sp.]|tara:strand:+ start:14802 stop:16226 length:1425 start_codon:yes stop_codon:yes gene_type:complete
MLRISGRPFRHCDGILRREFLTIGTFSGTALSLPTLLRAENQHASSQHASSQRAKSLIMVHLDGGAPQYETIDPKISAPSEIRGPFAPISTAVPGIQICELMPKVAADADKFAFIRSLTGSVGRHDAFQCQSGFAESDLKSMGGRPALGCTMSRLESQSTDQVPTFVDMMQGRPLVRNSARAGFLGPAYQPFRPDMSAMFERELESGMKGELKRLGGDHTVSLTLNEALSTQRMDRRLSLLDDLDKIRSAIDQQGMMQAMDQFQQQAVSILTSGKLAEAVDLSQEDPRIVERYTLPENRPGDQSVTSESSHSVKKFLMARRLIEAGVRVVSLSISDFDTHSSNFPRMQNLLPIVDHGLTTLVADLEERGLLEDVTILAWGEFGRTPRVNKNGGRDHWPKVGPAILAGGGLKTGQVIGATDRLGAEVADRPVTYKDMFATVYHQLGINPHQITINDLQGRPQYLLDEGEAIRELL